MKIKVVAKDASVPHLISAHSNLMLAAGHGGIDHIELTDANGATTRWVVSGATLDADHDHHETDASQDNHEASVVYNLTQID